MNNSCVHMNFIKYSRFIIDFGRKWWYYIKSALLCRDDGCVDMNRRQMNGYFLQKIMETANR